jgi:hypothetical protein
LTAAGTVMRVVKFDGNFSIFFLVIFESEERTEKVFMCSKAAMYFMIMCFSESIVEFAQNISLFIS